MAKAWFTVLATALVLLSGDGAGVAQSHDQGRPPARHVARTRPRVHVTPGQPLYRQCVDGYREVWRPYWGETVIMPYMHCWWVRG